MPPRRPSGAGATPVVEPSGKSTAVVVLLLTLVAAALRLVWLDRSPPGLNQDEAINAWNAWCLLGTGRDMSGAHWPLFYFHSIGDNRTPFLIYWLLPFQALGGLSVLSMRAAAAFSGILCVPLAYFVGMRLFGRAAGLTAASMLVLNPWHLAGTRWAIDGSMAPFLSLATLAAILWARLPVTDGEPDGGRPWHALFAGLVAGLACYGYWALRVHIPLMLLLAALFTWRGWTQDLFKVRRWLPVLAFVLGFAILFGPLVAEHLRDPAVAIRARMTRLWEPGTPLPEIVRRLSERYALHFRPEFLFVRADTDPGNSPADSGAFEWAMLPCLLAGLVVAASRARHSRSAAFLLALVLAYPAGDLLARYDGVHAFRSAPGLPALVLLAAFGLVQAWRALARRNRSLAWGMAATVALAAIAQDARSLATYFGEWRERPPVYSSFHTDFMQACRWVRENRANADAVFWTADRVNMPFALTLVGLGYDPARWLADEKDVRVNADGWEYYVRYGKHYFLYGYGELCRPYVDALRASGRKVHAVFVVRPGEMGLKNPVHVVKGSHGQDQMWICEGDL